MSKRACCTSVRHSRTAASPPRTRMAGDDTVELVDRPPSPGSGRCPCRPGLAVGETGRAPIAGPRVDLRESMAHGASLADSCSVPRAGAGTHPAARETRSRGRHAPPGSSLPTTRTISKRYKKCRERNQSDPLRLQVLEHPFRRAAPLHRRTPRRRRPSRPARTGAGACRPGRRGAVRPEQLLVPGLGAPW